MKNWVCNPQQESNLSTFSPKVLIQSPKTEVSDEMLSLSGIAAAYLKQD